MSPTRSSHRLRTLALGLGAAILGLASLVAPTVAQNATVQIVETDMYGPILVDHNGMTLYTWVVDQPPVSACYGNCATSWPPALVDGPVMAPPGLPGQMGTTQRNDGTMQLTYRDWPLYLWARDEKPGDVTGDGSMSSGGLWPVATTGALKPTVQLASHSGDTSALTDGNGMTVYTWAGDAAGMSHCMAECAVNWPPVLVEDRFVVGAGLSRVLDTITREDGTMQATYKGMPLYRFFRDMAPGDMNGQGLNGFGALWSVAMFDLI